MNNLNFIYYLYNLLFMNNIEKEVYDIFNKKKYIKFRKKINIVDVGCYKGQFSLSLSKKFDKKSLNKIKFYLIDPNNKHKNYYKKNLNFNYQFFNYAIDDKPESKKAFYINNFYEASGSSLKGDSFKDNKYMKSRTIIKRFLNPINWSSKMVIKKNVSTINIYDFCKKNNLDYIDILKIDTEGTEVDIIKGLKKYNKKISIICIEIQGNKNKIMKKIDFVNKALKKDFKLVYKKRIWIASFLTDIQSYDFIYSRV